MIFSNCGNRYRYCRVFLFDTLPSVLYRDAYVAGPEEQRPRLYALMKAWEAEGPFTACGFFTVGRPSLLAIFSTVVTYFIIMFQFTEGI